jgi:hypothetical protein
VIGDERVAGHAVKRRPAPSGPRHAGRMSFDGRRPSAFCCLFVAPLGYCDGVIAIKGDIKPIYTAVNADAVLAALDDHHLR